MSPRSVCVEAEHDVDAHPCSQRPQGKASWNHVPDRAGIPYDFQYQPVEDSTAGLGQSLRTGRPLVGGLSFHDV